MFATCLTLLVMMISGTVHSLDLGNCRSALGMQTHEIPDNYITASSSFDPVNVGPASSSWCGKTSELDHYINSCISNEVTRTHSWSLLIRTEVNGGAWCPREQVSPSVHEFLQIDLGALKVVTLVETQGRFGNGQGQEYMEQYKLEYQREESGPWFKFINRRGQEIFQGNSNTYIAELREVDPPIIARRVRFVPYSPHAKHICMRAEVYGCDWKDGLISYSMPQGDKRSADIDLQDSTYDGLNKDNLLVGGLGQLVDGDEGQSNFRLDPRSLGVRGYEWVGWKNDSSAGGWVEITFVFEGVRNFTGLKIHCNNMFSKDVRVFKMARVYFSVGGMIYSQEPIEYLYMKDSLIEYARTVDINLNHRVGRYVKVQLYFESRWIMISEVTFESDYAVGVILPETSSNKNNGILTLDNIGTHNNSNNMLSAGSRHNSNVQGGREFSEHADDNVMPHVRPVGGPPPTSGLGDIELDPHPKGRGMNDEYVGIVVGALVTFFLVSFALLVLFLWRRRSRDKYLSRHRVMKCSGDGNGVLDDSLDNRAGRHIGDKMKANGASKLLFGKFRGESALETRGPNCESASNMYNFFTPGGGGCSSDVDSDQACCGGVSNASVEFSFFRDPSGPPAGVMGGRKGEGRRLPELPSTPDSSDTYTSKEYFGTSYPVKASFNLNSPPNNCHTLQHAPPPYHLDQSAGSRRQPNYHSSTLRPQKGYYNSSVSQVQEARFNPALFNGTDARFSQDSDNVNITEVPAEQINFISTIGKGKFSEMRLSEMRDGSTLTSGSMVAKIITKTLTHIERENLEEDLRLMTRLNDENIVQLLAASSSADSSCNSCRVLLLEYMTHGNLDNYLKLHVQENSADSRSTQGQPVLSYSAQIFISCQIASAMKYLETRNLVHRYLSARECLVSENHCVKISLDFIINTSLAPSSSQHSVWDVRGEGVRWMAWESVILGQFSMKSDVWSFGMTMWEVLTLCRTAPLQDALPDSALLRDNFQCYYEGRGREVCPPQPPHCAREIYDLMRECWNREEGSRPTFKEIHMFLKRKNMGYDPREELNPQPLGSVVGGLSAVENIDPVIV